MDMDYDILGVNEAIIIGDYKNDGYTKNINKVFATAPLGYYEYFKELFKLDFKGVSFSKKMYIYKHYILFANLAARENAIKNVHGFFNKLMVLILWIPGSIATKRKFKHEHKRADFMDEGY